MQYDFKRYVSACKASFKGGDFNQVVAGFKRRVSPPESGPLANQPLECMRRGANIAKLAFLVSGWARQMKVKRLSG